MTLHSTEQGPLDRVTKTQEMVYEITVAEVMATKIVTVQPEQTMSELSMLLRDNRITGAILYGDVKDRAKILKAITDKTDINGIKTALMQWDLSALEN